MCSVFLITRIYTTRILGDRISDCQVYSGFTFLIFPKYFSWGIQKRFTWGKRERVWCRGLFQSKLFLNSSIYWCIFKRSNIKLLKLFKSFQSWNPSDLGGLMWASIGIFIKVSSSNSKSSGCWEHRNLVLLILASLRLTNIPFARLPGNLLN